MSEKLYDVFGDNLKGGCWYESEGGERVYCIGLSSSDMVLVESQHGKIVNSAEMHYRLLPDCYGWTWEESVDYPLQWTELQSDEWYESDLGCRCFCVGFSAGGYTQIQTKEDESEINKIGTAAYDRRYRHLPDCDGWDWDEKPEVVELTEENARDWPVRHVFAHKSNTTDSVWNLIMANEDEITQQRINNPHSAYMAVYPSMLDGFSGSK